MKKLLLFAIALVPGVIYADTTIQGDVGTSTFTITGPVSISTLTVSNLTVTNINGGSLHLLQAPVFATETTCGSTTSSSFVDKGASATITPTKTTSKIIGWISAPLASSSSTGKAEMGVSGTTNGDLYTTGNTPGWYRSYDTGQQGSTVTIFFQDSPGTTSSQTYHMRLASQGGATAYCGGGVYTGASTTILLMEVQ